MDDANAWNVTIALGTFCPGKQKYKVHNKILMNTYNTLQIKIVKHRFVQGLTVP